jgi:hypothetical protein
MKDEKANKFREEAEKLTSDVRAAQVCLDVPFSSNLLMRSWTPCCMENALPAHQLCFSTPSCSSGVQSDFS